MKALLLIPILLLACTGDPPTAPLEPASVNPHRIATPSVEAADNGPGHVCVTFFYGFCTTCMGNKARRDSVSAPYPGWQSYNPVPTIWGYPVTNGK